MEATDAAAAVPQKNPDRKNRRERKKSRRTNGGHAAAALQTRNPRPGRGRRPMNRHGRGTGARPAPGRAIRKRRSRRKRPARHPQSGMCKNPAWAAKNHKGGPYRGAPRFKRAICGPGHGRWPMNRRGRSTGARPAPGRAIRKRGNGAENRHKTRRKQPNAGRTAVRTVQQHERMGRIRPISRAGPTGKRTKIAMTAYAAHMRGRKDFYERRASFCMAVRASAYAQGGRQTFRLLFPRDDYVPANRLVDPVRKFQPRAAVLHGKAGVRKECGDLCARQNEYVP